MQLRFMTVTQEGGVFWFVFLVVFLFFTILPKQKELARTKHT